MRISWRRRVLTLGALCALALAAGGGGAPARGQEFVVAPTVYTDVSPTSYVLPTSYAVPTSYVLPTSYVVPTVSVSSPAYVATSYVVGGVTSYVVPTAYVTTSRRRARRAAYSYVPTSFVVPTSYYYVPTSYYVPTVYETVAVACAPDPCCPTAAPAAGTPRVSAAPSGSSSSVNGTGAPRATVDSEPANRGGGAGSEPSNFRETAPPPSGFDSSVPAPPTTPAPEPPAPAAGASTPITPAPATTGSGTPGASGETTKGQAAPPPPVAPDGPQPVVLPQGEATRRDVQRPVYRDARPDAARPAPRGTPGVLEGKVVALETGRPEEGVRLTLSNRLGTFADRVVLTDAYGRYAVRLPDGDWTVKVTMPSGRVYAAAHGNITVSGGRITNDLGQDVPSLIITR